MPAHTNAYRLAVRAIADPLYPASQCLFAPSFDPVQAARPLAPQQDAVIAYCFDILDTEELNCIDTPGEGYAPANAVLLLAEWKVTAAVPRFWRILRDDTHSRPGKITLLTDTVLNALEAWGPTLIDDTLRIAEAVEGRLLATLGLILSLNAQADPRVYPWLQARFEKARDEELIQIWATSLLLADRRVAIPYLVARILTSRQYSQKLKGALRRSIRHVRETGLPRASRTPPGYCASGRFLGRSSDGEGRAICSLREGDKPNIRNRFLPILAGSPTNPLCHRRKNGMSTPRLYRSDGRRTYLLIFICFGYELLVSQPPISTIIAGLIPSTQIVFNPSALYIAIGILGATVMPHNLYLHSSIVQTRIIEPSEEAKRRAIKFASIDSTGSLLFAFFIKQPSWSSRRLLFMAQPTKTSPTLTRRTNSSPWCLIRHLPAPPSPLRYWRRDRVRL